MAESDIATLQESPSDQYDIVQNLYAELEKEREASTIAANAALAMILRLQGEKAAEKMEACQYKRMAEEKIHHTEESLAIFKEVLYQKDLEIASLKFQVRAYRDRLSKNGTSSPTFVEMDCLKTPSLSQTNASMGNMSFHGTMSRKFTLSDMRFMDKCNEMDVIDDEMFSPLKRRSYVECFDKLINSTNDQENARGLHNMLPDRFEESPISDISFCCHQVEAKSINMKETSNSRKFEEKLEPDCALAHGEFEMSMPIDSLSLGPGHMPYSSYSTASSDTFYDSTIEVTETMLGTKGILPSSQSEYLGSLQDVDSRCHSYLESELPMSTICCTRFQDIFEVPQCAKDHNSELKDRIFRDCIRERKDVHLMTYSISKDARDRCFKNEEQLNEVSLDGQYGTMLPAPRKGVCLDYNWACNDNKNGAVFHQNVEELWQSDIKQLTKRLQVLEDDRKVIKQGDPDRGEEQLKLLKEISEQLSMIHSHVKRLPVKKYCPEDNNLIVFFMEAMLSFSV